MLNSFMSYLGSTVTPGQAGNQLWALIYVFIIFTGVSLAVVCMNWIERKALAHFQIRLGPMRVGPHGLLQPIADALKLMLKEDIIPAEADQFVFWVHRLYGDSVRSVAGSERHEYRHSVHARSFVAGCARHCSGGVGVEFTLSLDGCVALERADGVV
jgi:NADH dehydrogenase